MKGASCEYGAYDPENAPLNEVRFPAVRLNAVPVEKAGVARSCIELYARALVAPNTEKRLALLPTEYAS